MSGTGDGRVTLYVRQGCHLCDDARAVLAAALAERGADAPAWDEVDVDSDADLADRYGDLVPVVTVDGVVQGYWRLDGDRVRRALAAAR